MGLRPAVSPPISPAEMELLVSRAGLVLNPGQMADLVLAWRQLLQLAAMIPRDRQPADDLGFVFRPAPPQRLRTTKAAARSPAPRPRPKTPAAAPQRSTAKRRR